MPSPRKKQRLSPKDEDLIPTGCSKEQSEMEGSATFATGSNEAASTAQPLTAGCRINNLPQEILIRIFASVNHAPSLCRASVVCTYWHTLITDPTTDKDVWLPLAQSLCGRILIPSNESSAGSLVPGRYEKGSSYRGDGRWRYLYRDVVRNAWTFCRVPLDEDDDDQGEIELTKADCSLPPLSEIPEGEEGHVVRKFDIMQVATEGSRTHYAPPIVSVKVPNFSDSLAPGETTAGEGIGWLSFVDSTLHVRYKGIITRQDQDPQHLHSAFTVQKGLIRAGADGILGTGDWDIKGPHERKKQQKQEEEPEGSSKNADERKDDEKEKEAPSLPPSAAWLRDIHAIQLANAPKIAEIMRGEHAQTRDQWLSSEGSICNKWTPLRWIRPVDTGVFPNARMWDMDRTLMKSIERSMQGSVHEGHFDSIRGPLSGSLANILKSMVHSDANLRLVINRYPIRKRFEEFVVAEVERLAIPAEVSSVEIKGEGGQEPVPVVNKRWKIPDPATGFKLSLNSVPVPPEIREDRDALVDETYWTEDDDIDFEEKHTWEYRSCGEYLIACDDTSGHGPSTISCFKAGAAGTERMQLQGLDQMRDPKPAVVRNMLVAQDSDLYWQRQMRTRLKKPQAVRVHGGEEIIDDDADFTVDYFIDNDGLSMTSKAVVYSTRKQVLTLRTGGPDPNTTHNVRSIMQFHVLSLETGQTISVLHLPEEEQDLHGGSWYGWCSFAVSDTHLVASVGGTVPPENARDIWETRSGRRYGKKAVYIWPLDNDEETPPEPKYKLIPPSGRLGYNLEGYPWWTKRDKYVSISRDGRYVGVSSDWTFVVFDMWDGGKMENIYRAQITGNVPQPGNRPFVRPRPGSDRNCLPWNGLWIKYRDVLQPKPLADGSVPTRERTLTSGMVYINARILRMLVDGVKPYDPAELRTRAQQEEWRRFTDVLRRWYGPGGGAAVDDSESEDSEIDISDTDGEGVYDDEEEESTTNTDSEEEDDEDNDDDDIGLMFFNAAEDVDIIEDEGDLDLVFGDDMDSDSETDTDTDTDDDGGVYLVDEEGAGGGSSTGGGGTGLSMPGYMMSSLMMRAAAGEDVQGDSDEDSEDEEDEEIMGDMYDPDYNDDSDDDSYGGRAAEALAEAGVISAFY